MIIHTASEGVSLARKLEDDTAKFYQEVAQKHTADADTLLGYAKENKKNVSNIERSYYSVITDALEGGYAFNLDDAEYPINVTVGDDYSAMIKQAQENEASIVKFYEVAAEQSRALMADLPRTMTVVNRKHIARVEELKALAAKS
jgi:hypothetical protein